MKRKNNLKSLWLTVRRHKLYYVYVTIVYFLIAAYDSRNSFFLADNDGYIARYNFQQIVIIFCIIVTVLISINEDYLVLYEDYLRLYTKDGKRFFGDNLVLLSLANIVPFIIGETVVLLFNYVHSGWIPFTLFLVNTIIVSMEITISIMLSMAFLLLLKKNILVCLFYYITTFTLLLANNVYLSIPLTIRILRDRGAYYITFAPPLWIGRCILLLISGTLYYIALHRFTRRFTK